VKNLHIAIIFSLVCAGCTLPPIPIPEHAADYSDRKPIGEESLGFLEVGSTKREEVLLTLGIPEYTQDHERAFVYEWDTVSGWIVDDNLATPAKKHLTHKTYQLLIEFDDIGILKGFEIKDEEVMFQEKQLF
jgi:outer membrane protein assembly factor BamE (lipoprotein component of BamABCDE complex)